MKITIERNKNTFTKKWVSRLLWFGCVCISLSYALAFLGKEQIAESLSQTIATVVIATILGYLCKAFFETREEERMKLEKNKLKIYNKGEDFDGGLEEETDEP